MERYGTCRSCLGIGRLEAKLVDARYKNRYVECGMCGGSGSSGDAMDYLDPRSSLRVKRNSVKVSSFIKGSTANVLAIQSFLSYHARKKDPHKI